MQKRKVIQIVTKRGFILSAFEGDSITQEVQKKGEYDANTLNSIMDLLTIIQPNISLDIGANIGNHALVIAKNSKKLIGFEPVKFVFDVLQSNMQKNHIDNATLLDVGLSDHNAQVNIHIPANGNLGSSSIEVEAEDSDTLNVITIAGDNYLQENFVNQPIDFIKIDVEGHEAMALLGLKKTIKMHQPLVLIEWKSANTKTQFRNLNLFDELFSGYDKYSLSHTANKKIYVNAKFGFVKRIFYKLIGPSWCFGEFDPAKNYSNVYLVPARYKQAIAKLAVFKI